MNHRIGLRACAAGVVGAAIVGTLVLLSGPLARSQSAANMACPVHNAGITLSPGFCATVFADNIGHARHLVVASNGVVYVNTWSGRYYHFGKVPPEGFLVALKDSKGDGHADIIKRFGPSIAQGAAGGTGIAFYNGAIYAEEKDKIVRYALGQDDILPKGPSEVIVSGLPLSGDHPMHPIAIDAAGHLYVDLGSATNSCQLQNRMPQSPGISPCTELKTRGGTWRYDANKRDQKFSAAERFATGLRNGEGFGFDSAGRMFATQHGRDQLWQNWPKFYSVHQGANLPAEELVQLKQGADYGWPECYFDGLSQNKLMLSPEYGGDGKTVGVCAQKQEPVAFFPAHWAPNALLIDNFEKFPAAYRGGAFIAFHGSWNRAPEPQGGYNVVFQPLDDGKAAGPFIVFADGFAGPIKDPGLARFRPTGLAAGADGALYIADDVRGRIWRVVYKGAPNADIAPAPAPQIAASSGGEPEPPEGINPNAGLADIASLPVPPGATKDQVALGDRIFHGEVDGGTCSGCHGGDAKGTSVGPDLTSGKWVWGDGSLASIAQTITYGVPNPKLSTGVMPPKGGANLSDADVAAVAAYVWAIGHKGGHS
jgi:glucose/arabinose dehydrogenase/mono/diheme cytochrome c family protein